MPLLRFLTAALSLSLAACANTLGTENTAETAPDPRRGEEVRNLCFASNIDGFGETTKRSVVVTEGRKQYLIETYNRCFDLDHAQSIAFDRHSSCLSRGDGIFAFDSAFGPDRQNPVSPSCTVKAIYEWNKDATEISETVDDNAEETETVEQGAPESEVEETGSEETEVLEPAGTPNEE